MVQAGGGARRAIEQLQLGVVQAPASLEKLDSHRAREHAIARLEYPSEAALTDLTHYLEAIGDDRARPELLRRREVLYGSTGDLAKSRLEGLGLRLVRACRLASAIHLPAPHPRHPCDTP